MTPTYKTRTNYFRVKDKAAFDELISKVGCAQVLRDPDNPQFAAFANTEDDMFIYVDDNDNIIPCHSPEAEDCDICDSMEPFWKELQKLVADDDAIIIKSVTYEGLRSVDADLTIITANDIRFINLDEEAVKIAAAMLNNPDWRTRTYY